MPGLIDSTQQEPTEEPVAPEAPAQDSQGELSFRSKVIEAIPPNLRDAFQRVVLAGRKILYSKEMFPEIKKELDRNVPVWQKLGEGIAKLVALVDNQSGKKIPQELLIPVGMELVAEMSAAMKDSGQGEMSAEDLQKAQIYVAVCIGKLYGASDEQLKGLAQGGAPTQPTTQVPGQQMPQPEPEMGA